MPRTHTCVRRPTLFSACLRHSACSPAPTQAAPGDCPPAAYLLRTSLVRMGARRLKEDLAE